MWETLDASKLLKMKLPQTPEDLKTEILTSSDNADELGDLRIRQLIKILAAVDSEIIVEGVIKVFEIENRPDKLYQDQQFAGTILRAINPKSQKDLKGFLKRTLDNWDKSVEELPFWFRDNYGLEKVKEAFNKVDWTESQKEKLETMKFWLQLRAANA
jgi:hypothetical protein